MIFQTEKPTPGTAHAGSYSADDVVEAYIEPVAVGDSLIDMPLFLAPNVFIQVPLETTYQSAWNGVPQRWKSVLTGD